MSKNKTNSWFGIFAVAFGAFLIIKKKSSVSKIGAFAARFFTVASTTTIDDLKKQYYKLAKIHHPDTGGTNESFRSMNDEYELLQKLILVKGNFSETEQENEQSISEIYRDIIDSIITIPGIIIELVGSWIWISGNTYPVKEQIKSAGFKFHSKKSMWFWYPGEYKKSNKGEMEMDDIKNKYGSETIKNRTYNRLSGINGLSEKLIKLQSLLMKRESFNKQNN